MLERGKCKTIVRYENNILVIEETPTPFGAYNNAMLIWSALRKFAKEKEIKMEIQLSPFNNGTRLNKFQVKSHIALALAFIREKFPQNPMRNLPLESDSRLDENTSLSPRPLHN